MEESKKKPIMIGIIVVCLALAGVITFCRNGSVSPDDLDVFKGELIWVKCRNPNCEAEYQMDKKKYFEWMRDNTTPMTMEMPAMVCEKCGEESAYRAIKCEKCGLVFERYAAGPGELADRCPKCGYSKIEAKRERVKAERAAARARENK